MTHLTFWQTGSSPHLVFGQAEVALPAADVVAHIQTELPGLAGHVTCHVGVVAALSANLPTLGVHGTARYASLAARPEVAGVGVAAQAAQRASASLSAAAQQPLSMPFGVETAAQNAARVGAACAIVCEGGVPISQTLRGSFEEALPPLKWAIVGVSQSGVSTPLHRCSWFRNAFGAGKDAQQLVFQDGVKAVGPRNSSPTHVAMRVGVALHTSAQVATPSAKKWVGLFQPGRVPPPGIRPSTPKPPVGPPDYWGTDFLFQCPPLETPYVLLFGAHPCGGSGVQPGATLFIRTARYYMAVNTVEAFLLPDMTPLPIFDLSLSADIGSTVWTFSAITTFSNFDALVPTAGQPRKVRVEVNGMGWVFMVDSLQQTERFGKRGAKMAGCSVTALVAQPYALPVSWMSTSPYTAQQLAGQAVDLTGVGVDWGIDDWLVPAGVWSHFGAPLSAVQAIAQAAGGYIGSHRSDPTVLVRHPYPTLPGGIPGGPWNWEGAGGSFAADVELAPSAIISRSVDRSDGPSANGVYVSGTTTGGIEVHILRSGTLGDQLASMVTNPLITDLPAASQMGYSVLGLSGAKHKVQITLPVLTGATAPGVIDVGKLVQVNDSVPWRGRVRAVNVNFSAPTLRQSLTLERHLP